MVSLNELRSAAVALDWHEAVAAGAALATILAEAPACPHPADVALLPSGDLRVTGPRVLDGSAAAGVAQVLAQLLASAPCPAELRQLIEQRRDDATSTTADLVAQLAFFERPGRREVLAAVALRAAPAIEQARHAAALQALTARTRQASGAAPVPVAPMVLEEREAAIDEAPQAGDEPDGHGPGRLLVPAAIGLLAFLVVAYLAAAWFDRPPPGSPRVAAEEETLPISGQVSPGAAVPKPRPGPGATRPASKGPSERKGAQPAAGGASVSAPAPTPGTPAPTAQPAPSPGNSASSGRSVDVLVAERDGRVVPSTIAPVRPAPRAAPSGQIFQVGDPQVTPAVLIRPHLPENPPADVPAEQIGTLEFVIAESGAVEHVHLVSPANRYQERMLVAAAKNWLFRPATRDGRPVRFRTRVRLTL